MTPSLRKALHKTTRTTPSLPASFAYSPRPLPCLYPTGFVQQRPPDLDDHKDDQSTMTMVQAGRRHASLAALVLLGLQLTTTMAFVFPASSLSTPSQGTSWSWSSWFGGKRERGTHHCTLMTHPGTCSRFPLPHSPLTYQDHHRLGSR